MYAGPGSNPGCGQMANARQGGQWGTGVRELTEKRARTDT